MPSILRFSGIGFGRSIWMLVTVVALVGTAQGATAPYNYFSYTGTPGSWIGQGRSSYFISSETNWTFYADFDATRNHVALHARRTDPNPPLSDYYWDLDLAPPAGQSLVPGLYDNAARYPFQSPSQPGMWLSGNHRGDNQISGYYHILEAEYGPGNTISRFAVDFRQFDETNPNQWVDGQFRYNSTVPEPSSLA